MAAALTPFAGFGTDALEFLAGLEADNSKAYFDANRSVYDEQVAAPLKSLVVAVGERLDPLVVSPLEFAPKIGGSLFRINRDRRFNKDLPPYQTHLDACWWTGASPKTEPSFIMRITADDVLSGVGVYNLPPDRLQRWRDAVVSDAGDDVERIIAQLAEPPASASISEPSRKRVPKGWPADHPRADLLRRDGFHVSGAEPAPASIVDADFVDWVVERLVRFADLHHWLVENV